MAVRRTPQRGTPNAPLHHPESVDRLQMLAILGMHSGGTSVTTGMLQDQGVDFGEVEDEPTWMQPRGTREHLPLYRLGLDLLHYNGGSWRRPPVRRPLRWTAEHVARRNEVLSTYTRSPCGFKDPNTLVLLDFWRDVPLRFIGVIRNPVSTARSLVWRERRARHRLGDRIWYLRRRQWQLSVGGGGPPLGKPHTRPFRG